MHVITHFVVSLDILLLLDHPLWKACLFALCFGVLIDLDLLAGYLLDKPTHHLRSWVQEPFALLLVALPIAFALSLKIDHAYVLVLVPYASHIALDYLARHEVCPLAPFSRKRVDVGLVRPFGTRLRKGTSEWWVLTPALIVLALVLV